MRAVIVIPFRGTDTWRRAAFEKVHAQAKRTGLPVIVGDSGTEPFSIARTWNLLAEEAGDWDRLIRWGSDFLLQDHEQIHAALASERAYVLASDSTHRQTRHEAKTGQVTFDGTPTFGGPNIITRELWDVVGGFDARFVGYGAEDYAFVHGTELFTGPRMRVRGGMCALWHPKPKRTPEAAADAYMGMREPNLKLWQEQIRPIDSHADWFDYLTHRYDHGLINPFAGMSLQERATLW